MTRSTTTTRRAPHMEHFTEVVRSGPGKYTLHLKIDHQTFQIGELGQYTFSEVRWTRDMLCIALDRLTGLNSPREN